MDITIVSKTFGICVTDTDPQITDPIIDEPSTQNEEHFTENSADITSIDASAIPETLQESQIRTTWNREEIL